MLNDSDDDLPAETPKDSVGSRSVPCVFVCCAKEDTSWRTAVVKHLIVAAGGRPEIAWSDDLVLPGGALTDEVDKAIDGAAAAIVIISVDFLASRTVQSFEIPRLRQRHATGRLRIFPLLIRGCSWSAIDWLRDLPMWPDDRMPLALENDVEREVLLTRFCEHVYETVMRNEGSAPARPRPRSEEAWTLVPPLDPRPPPARPYPLLEAYDHPQTFAGRDDALRDVLFDLSSQKLLLCLYSQSGVGKSSFLRASLVPQLREQGYPVALHSRPDEPGLVRRLAGDLALLTHDEFADDHDFLSFADFLAALRYIAGKPPVLILDQFEDVFRRREGQPSALHRLGCLLAATAAHPLPSSVGFPCRWVLAYRQEFHGEVVAWLEDVLRYGSPDDPPARDALPSNLNRTDYCHVRALPPFAASRSGKADESMRMFLEAIQRPLRLRTPEGKRVYPWRFAKGAAEALAGAFAEARIRDPRAPLTPELQVVLDYLLQSSSAANAGRGHLVTVPANVGQLIDSALGDHLRRKLTDAFRSDGHLAQRRRTAALLALHSLTDGHGQRGAGVPVGAMRESLGGDGGLILDRLESTFTRLLIQEQTSDLTWVYVLPHDRLAAAIDEIFANAEERRVYGLDEEIVDLYRRVALYVELFERGDTNAVDLPGPVRLRIERTRSAMPWGHRAQAWWNAVEARRASQRLRLRRRLRHSGAIAALGVLFLGLYSCISRLEGRVTTDIKTAPDRNKAFDAFESVSWVPYIGGRAREAYVAYANGYYSTRIFESALLLDANRAYEESRCEPLDIPLARRAWSERLVLGAHAALMKGDERKALLLRLRALTVDDTPEARREIAAHIQLYLGDAIVLPHPDDVDAAFFLGDKRFVLTRSSAQTFVWDRSTGTLLLRIHHSAHLQVRNTSTPLILIREEDRIKIWSAPDGNAFVHKCDLPHASVSGSTLLAGGGRVLSESAETLKLWDADSCELIHELRQAEGAADQGWSSLSAWDDWQFILRPEYDLLLVTPDSIERLFADERPYSAALSADGGHLAVALYSAEGTSMWRFGDSSFMTYLRGRSTGPGAVFLFNAYTQEGFTFPAGNDIVSVGVESGGRYVVTGHATGRVAVWDSWTGEETRSFPFKGPPVKVQFSPSGEQVIALSFQEAEAWDVATGEGNVKALARIREELEETAKKKKAPREDRDKEPIEVHGSRVDVDSIPSKVSSPDAGAWHPPNSGKIVALSPVGQYAVVDARGAGQGIYAHNTVTGETSGDMDPLASIREWVDRLIDRWLDHPDDEEVGRLLSELGVSVGKSSIEHMDFERRMGRKGPELRQAAFDELLKLRWLFSPLGDSVILSVANHSRLVSLERLKTIGDLQRTDYRPIDFVSDRGGRVLMDHGTWLDWEHNAIVATLRLPSSTAIVASPTNRQIVALGSDDGSWLMNMSDASTIAKNRSVGRLAGAHFSDAGSRVLLVRELGATRWLELRSTDDGALICQTMPIEIVNRDDRNRGVRMAIDGERFMMVDEEGLLHFWARNPGFCTKLGRAVDVGGNLRGIWMRQNGSRVILWQTASETQFISFADLEEDWLHWVSSRRVLASAKATPVVDASGDRVRLLVGGDEIHWETVTASGADVAPVTGDADVLLLHWQDRLALGLSADGDAVPRSAGEIEAVRSGRGD